MPLEDYAVDEPFFREWKQRSAGERRSLERAARLVEAFGLLEIEVAVVGISLRTGT
jgi:hypothetical protein